MRGTSLFNQRKQAQAQERKAEAKRLQARGLPVPEIAAALDRSEHQVRMYLYRPQAAGLRPYPGTWITVEEKAEQMAACYPDPERQAWIRAQMQAWDMRQKR